jgi:hypothetical protein
MPHGSAAIVGRQSHLVELRGCSITAHALALCVEVGGAPCAIELTGNSISIQDPAAAAISVFGSADIHQPAGVQLRLESNVVSAGRLAGFKALTGGLQMEARNNEFTFSEALLSFVAYPSSSSWRSASSWRGLENHYLGTADWLQVDGRSLGVHDLTEWQAFWASPETGSFSAPPGSGLSFSMRASGARAP